MRFVELEVCKQNGAPRGQRKVRVAAEAIVTMEAQGGGKTTLLTLVNGDELRVVMDQKALMAAIAVTPRV